MTTALIGFTPIYGAFSDALPVCYLLEIDEFTLLLDCGWDDHWDVNLLKPLEKYIPRINGVLVSYPDIPHLGGLPYLVGKMGLNAPIYATIPVHKMGLLLMYDVYQSKHNQQDFTIFNLDDVDAAFEKVQQLKYSQRVVIGDGIEISPHPAGRIVGGTIWKIKKETEEIIYSIDFNHKRERHLNAASLENLGKPSLMITESLNVINTTQSKKSRDQSFLETVLKTLQSGGDVLIPTDTSGRVLELLVILDQFWAQNKIAQFGIALLTNVSFNTIEFAKSQLEWMSDPIMNAFDHGRENPFAFKHVRLCHDTKQLEGLPKPNVILATMPDLECGFAREIFLSICSNPKNSVIFTERVAETSLAKKLITQQGPQTLTLNHSERVLLEGEELEEYQRKKAEENQKMQLSDEEDEEEQDDAMMSKISFQEGPDMTTNQFAEKGFRHPVFPSFEKHSIFDDYGEAVMPNEIAVSDIVPPKPIMQDLMETEAASPEEAPSKIVSKTITVNVNCVIQLFDFEGRCDGRSLKNILHNIAPRKLILVHGSEEATEILKTYCQTSIANCKLVLTPKPMERVDVSSDTTIYKLKIKDTLYDTLNYHQVQDYQISFITGQIHYPDQNTAHPMPILEEDPYPPGHMPSFIGDVKLSDLKQVLAEQGYKSDLYGGVLVACDGTIKLSKKVVEGKPRIKIEGAISTDYFKIRSLLYRQFTFV